MNRERLQLGPQGAKVAAAKCVVNWRQSKNMPALIILLMCLSHVPGFWNLGLGVLETELHS